jgi:hypothetical protein
VRHKWFGLGDCGALFTEGHFPGTVPVLGVTLKTLEARRYQDAARGAQVRVDHNSNLSRVTVDAQGRLQIEFGFTTSFGALGMVKVEGDLLLDTNAGTEAVAKWEKDRNLPPEMAQEVHTAILSACIPEAVGLAKGVRLPPPIPIPQVRFGDKGTAATQATKVDGPDAA